MIDTFLRPDVWIVILATAAFGVFVGAVPGLTATMAVALFVPLTYWLDPAPALAGIVTMVACAIFAGDIPTTLLRIPGTPASAAYADDAYGLTRRGRAGDVLAVAVVFSVTGGLFGALVLMVLGPQLARVATMFAVAEYFWLYLLGLSCAVVVSRGSALRALFALLVGLLLSTVGLSAVHTEARFTCGLPELYQGITFIPAMIGLFGVSEVLNNLARLEPSGRPGTSTAEPVGAGACRLGPAAGLLWHRKPQFLRSSTLGTVIGMLPGAGADIAAWVSLAVSKRFGRLSAGDRDRATLASIGDATAANSSALAGGWIPALVFGIPGDSVTAIAIGVLMMKNVQPGPDIFSQQTALVYTIYATFVIANLVLIPIGLLAARTGAHIVRVPRRVLLPMILLFCVVGAFALNGSAFDILIMLGMGLLGFALERRAIPLGPVVLGIILGGPLEERLLQAMTAANGSVWGLVDRPVAAVLGVLTLAVWVATLVLSFRPTTET